MERILIFGDVTAHPFINNLMAPVRAFQRVGDVNVLEPRFAEGFTPTGAAAPARVPDTLISEGLSNSNPTIVICLGGGLFVPSAARQLFASGTIFAGFAFSDPLGLAASLTIAPEFDLFYTQDPQTIDDYFARGIDVRRGDLAIDPELYYPIERDKECDILFYGKWTPYRDETLGRLASRYTIRLHGYAQEKRWSISSLPPLDDPQALCEAINRSRLGLEFAILDDAVGKYRGTSRITNRAQFAAACGVPCLIDWFDRLPDFFEPGTEIVAYRSPDEMMRLVESLLGDETHLREIGMRARMRVLREQTWDVRVKSFLADIRALRKGADVA